MKHILRFICAFFRYLGKFFSALRILLLNLLILGMLFVVLIPFFSTTEVPIQESSALLLSLDGDIVEEKHLIDPLNDLLNDSVGLKSLPSETLLQDILDAIQSAQTDNRIRCIVLNLKNMGKTGLNQMNDIGKALDEFKANGKKVIAAEDYYTQNQYYIASFADTIILNPMGGVDLHGFGLYRLYFKGALDKLRINYHVFRVGTYKSAVEPIVRDSMSAEDKEQSHLWLSSLWKGFTENITTQRGLPADAVDMYSNNISSELALTGGDTAMLALNSGLVDELQTREELLSHLISLTAPNRNGGFRHVTLKEYLKNIDRSYQYSKEAENKIGILVAQGNILNGTRPPGSIGGDSLAKLIRQARTDEKIKGIVLRIDSGGGSVFASEVIRQELLSLKKSGKSFVVSMGSMAASGGYWIAADADEIWASSTTLTGSIGIFGAIPTFEDTLADMGITRDGIGTTALASGVDLTQPLSPILKEAIQLTLNHGYEQFMSIVENGRDMKRNTLDAYAQGRVFDGKRAQEIGLVDKLGDLEDAVNAAAYYAGLDIFSAEYVHKPSSLKDRLLKHFGTGLMDIIQLDRDSLNVLAKLFHILSPLKEMFLFNDPQGMYAHCMLFNF